MVNAGVTEIVMIFAMFFGGSVGIPISLPPAEPDALLEKVSPDEAVFYTQWSGVAPIDSNSDNPTEQLFAEPEVQEFIKRAEATLRTALARAGQRDPQAQMAATMVPSIVRTLATRPLMVYVDDVTVLPNGAPSFKAGLVVNLGDNFGAVTRMLETIPADATTDVTIDGTAFRRLQPPAPGSPAITFGTRGAYLIATVGEGETEALLARAATPAPAWIGELRERFPVDRVATIARMDLAAVLETAKPALTDPMMQRIVQVGGLDALRQYVAVSGLDANGFTQFGAVDIEGEPRGLLAMASRESLKSEDLAVIPEGALIGVAGKMDLETLLDQVLEMAGSLNPNANAQFNEALRQVESALGMRVREDILASLGDVWTLHTHESDGGLISGWTATVSLEDAAKMEQLSQRMMQLANQMGRGPKIRWNQFAGKNLFTVAVPAAEMPFAPTWAVADDHLVVGLFPQAVKSFLHRQKEDGPSVAANQQVAGMLESGVNSLSVVNNRRLAELTYPMMQIGMRMAAGAAAQQGISVDPGMLPSLTAISDHLGTGVSATRRTERGFEYEQHQVMPGGSIGSTAPVTIALVLPAVQAARQSARRVQSMNNLKQIGLAVHNFHDTFKSFPPRYNTDEDGKPLLSWRVYLLPYMEQNGLYEQFHLDEPWDSEHNKKLIEQMPAIYASPSSTLPPGKTTYLTIASKEAMFQGPKQGEQGKKFPRTTGFRDVLDGTSNTVMTVEANASSAVVWTKPDDYEYSQEDPAKGLRGVYPDVILMGFGDGSVRAVANAVDTKVLNAIFTRAGGEVVSLP